MKVLIVACAMCFVALLSLHSTAASPVAVPAAAPAAAPEPHKRKFGRFEPIALVPVAPVYVQPQPVYVQPQPVFVQPQPVFVHPQPVIVQQPIIRQPIVQKQIHHEWSFSKSSGFWK